VIENKRSFRWSSSRGREGRRWTSWSRWCTLADDCREERLLWGDMVRRWRSYSTTVIYWTGRDSCRALDGISVCSGVSGYFGRRVLTGIWYTGSRLVVLEFCIIQSTKQSALQAHSEARINTGDSPCVCRILVPTRVRFGECHASPGTCSTRDRDDNVCFPNMAVRSAVVYCRGEAESQ